MKRLVTGNAGFIGKRLFNSFSEPAYGFDIKERMHVSGAVLGSQVTHVFHLGSRVGMGESQYRIGDYCRDNIVGTADLLEALEREGTVEHMVLASSVSAMVGGSPYAATKACQEDLCAAWCERNGVTLSILRLYNVYGPGQSLTNPYTGVAAIFAQRLLAGLPPVVFEDGLQIRDFVHVDDVVRAMRMAADVRFNGVAEIGTGEPTHIIDLANLLRDRLGGPLPVITGDRRLGDVRDLRADVRPALEGFGWRPEVALRDGVKDLADSLRGQRPVVDVDAVMELMQAGGFAR